MKTTCSNCFRINDRLPQRYCKACHAAYMRKTRPSHSELDPVAKLRANARAYANTYLRRGKLKREPCFVCQSTSSQMHHPDYSRPLEIMWLCRPCHMEMHPHPGRKKGPG